MGSKKISFGFNKTVKKTNIFIPKREEPKNNVQLIDCLEGQSIKVLGGKEEKKGPLIIPLKDDARNLLDRVREAKKRDKVDETQTDNRPDSELTLDELAARQLLQEAKVDKIQNGTKVNVVPVSADKLPLNGEKEPSIEDYENVPISDFGFAMLRGMGWKEGMNIGKNQQQSAKVKEPELRPKGLGLGATKMVSEKKPKTAVDKEGKELQLIKGAYAKIIAGTHKGKYAEVQGLDGESSRIIVQTTLTREVLSLNEFLVVAVTKDEYEKFSRILNLKEYETFKMIPDNKGVSSSFDRRDAMQRSQSSSSDDDRRPRKSSSHRKKSRKERSRSRTPPRTKTGKPRRRIDSDTDSSESPDDRKHRKKTKKSKKQKERRRRNRSSRHDNDSSTSTDDY